MIAIDNIFSNVVNGLHKNANTHRKHPGVDDVGSELKANVVSARRIVMGRESR